MQSSTADARNLEGEFVQKKEHPILALLKRELGAERIE
jgi:hypothetical protein